MSEGLSSRGRGCNMYLKWTSFYLLKSSQADKEEIQAGHLGSFQPQDSVILESCFFPSLIAVDTVSFLEVQNSKIDADDTFISYPLPA